MEIKNDKFSYATLLQQVKARVLLAQRKAIYTANEEMLSMYWDIGKLLSESQKQIGWGNNALEQLANDLKNDYPKMKGFSIRNCQVMMQFYNEYNQQLTNTQRPVAYLESTVLTLPVKQLGWAHNVVLMQKVKDIKARYWYMIQCLKKRMEQRFFSRSNQAKLLSCPRSLSQQFRYYPTRNTGKTSKRDTKRSLYL